MDPDRLGHSSLLLVSRLSLRIRYATGIGDDAVMKRMSAWDKCREVVKRNPQPHAADFHSLANSKDPVRWRDF
jgi:hypothetical protein